MYHVIEPLSRLYAIDFVQRIFRKRGDVKILSRTSCTLGCGQQSRAALHCPCKQHLCRRLSNACGDGRNHWILKQPRLHSMTQRCECQKHNAPLLAEFQKLGFRQIGMCFYLDHSRLDACRLVDGQQFLQADVRQPDGPAPAVVQVESHPYLPETELLEFCKDKGIVFLAFAPLGHGMKPGLLEDSVITSIAARVGKTPAQVLLAWAVQRGTALLTTPRTAARAKENFNISPLPQDAFNEINGIQTRQRLNDVVNTGSPGFIPQSTRT